MGYTVALTGGIGSGKSTVADTFSRLGVNVIDADIIARQVVEPGTPALRAIAEHFGGELIGPEGTLNRRKLRERIFAHPEEKAWLNALLHPLIQQETQRQMREATSPYVLWVVPLLVENQLHKKADRVLVVDVSVDTQIQRTMARDNVAREHAEQILAAQATREARLAVADDVIDNNGAPDAIASDVARLHQQYLAYAAQAVLQENHNVHPRSF
ncbi:dephospho-CoA kinase [Silvania hatchlandensis]|uniref:Dephospho-CoA kinase n=1 Tax=Silvania hatchlandensis TaxID=2926469 RepID=A0A9J6PZC3_9ENTR|nr:dephospho-CoA kinase [Silvania hatchlandensis]MCU6664792.1 dephospho-CoA kinase [Silvania hatchlandensis]